MEWGAPLVLLLAAAWHGKSRHGVLVGVLQRGPTKGLRASLPRT